MLEVVALTSGARVPSARFRVRQHLTALAAEGIRVRECTPAISRVAPKPRWLRWLPAALALPKLAAAAPGVAASWVGQVTWLQRALLPGLPSLEPLLRRPLVFDVDDAIWLHAPLGERACRSIARRARVVVAGNEYLADWFRPYACDVQVVPTGIDTLRFRPRAAGVTRPPGFVIGWIGTSSNLPYLEAIQPALAGVLARCESARLLVVSDRRPRLPSLPSERVQWHPWSVESEVESLQSMDVGLMPLPNDPWTRGKCAFKILQYMACGLPVVASPVGMNAELLVAAEIGMAVSSAQEWSDALIALEASPALRARYGAVGRRVAEERFSAAGVARRLAAILRGAASGSP